MNKNTQTNYVDFFQSELIMIITKPFFKILLDCYELITKLANELSERFVEEFSNSQILDFFIEHEKFFFVLTKNMTHKVKSNFFLHLKTEIGPFIASYIKAKLWQSKSFRLFRYDSDFELLKKNLGNEEVFK
ncbi:hypothetical protein [[Mycoplasma] imitans]|uniref:hypothetical protein n=1 Tax=[Mycoplasma] imitans TaxID=29560 RepID=UPI0004886821|nr:hypothetical protein [[Mycoplasma] imitans]